ncbi:peptide ABC transporter permease [Longispora fulva]|uniref:Peptide/nickel transport system permease protein n=1 Tax=Longispora fulva TaxID=619741 RepID=A0A8J7GE45_9ACTN|nr:ABC transporter permease [Longispora fulva]MBG6136001.1 peptide/nickel transport system permease protein [Longispora fulva]GIG55757.1 peptide ABC transporter permease [Longispora fulva]
MIGYTLRRVPSALLVLLVASWVVFAILRLAPGDPAVVLAGPDPSPATIDAVRHQLGLDQSVWHQYATWLGGLLSGDLGTSYILGAPIGTLIGHGLGNTAQLAGAALLLAVLVGGAAGMALGTTRRKVTGQLLGGLVSLMYAVPPYVSGVLLVLVFAVTARVLPASGQVSVFDDPVLGAQYLIMPALCLALPAAAVIARFLAASMRRVLDEDFVATGVAKGISRRRLLWRHVLPNALPPVVTVLGIQIGQLLGGAIVVEAIFAWPGVGLLLLSGVLGRDYLLVQDLLMLAVTVFVVLQSLTGIAHTALDPRMRDQEGR